jgi:uncharacterized membrane protein
MLENLPEWLQIFIGSMIPGVEAKFIVPLAIHQYGWQWWHAYPIGIIGNMILVPLGLIFLYKIEEFLSRFKTCKKAMDKVFPKIRRKADKKIQQYESLALLLFVAIPLPLTGAGLGVLVAYLFDLKFSRALLMIFIGVLIATTFTTLLYIGFSYLIYS